MGGHFSKIANGNISTCRFVKLDSTDQGRVVLCGAGDGAFGISQAEERRLALDSWQDGFAAIAGEMVNVIGPGDDEALLDIGGTITVGDLLKSDASGKGVVTAADGDHINGQALQSGVSGDRILVKPMRFDRGA